MTVDENWKRLYGKQKKRHLYEHAEKSAKAMESGRRLKLQGQPVAPSIEVRFMIDPKRRR
jgi:hypothetical protein